MDFQWVAGEATRAAKLWKSLQRNVSSFISLHACLHNEHRYVDSHQPVWNLPTWALFLPFIRGIALQFLRLKFHAWNVSFYCTDLLQRLLWGPCTTAIAVGDFKLDPMKNLCHRLWQKGAMRFQLHTIPQNWSSLRFAQRQVDGWTRPPFFDIFWAPFWGHQGINQTFSP